MNNSNYQNNSLIIGQIKELLSSFNFPIIKVWNKNVIPYDGRRYIKGKNVVVYDNSTYKVIHDYVYNKQVLDLTKKFIINSSDYDNYTHEMLGEYLRCLRDMKSTDLMCLYNCFNGEQPTNLYKNTIIERNSDDYHSAYNRIFEVDSTDPRYKYYIVPAKFDEYYTIAINSACAYEIAGIIYDNASIEQEDSELIAQTYERVNSSMFVKPFVYKGLRGTDFAKTNYSRERFLKILIKIPSNVKSSITVLEGDYSNKTNIADGRSTHYIFGDREDQTATYLTNLISKYSLLKWNDTVSNPFSDRLIEYLLGQAITNSDTIYKNIERVQRKEYYDALTGYLGIWDDALSFNIFKDCQLSDYVSGSGKRYGNEIDKYYPSLGGWLTVDIDDNDKKRKLFIEKNGVWEVYKKNGEEVFVDDDKTFCDIYDDLTYYVDKDIESMLDIKEQINEEGE